MNVFVWEALSAGVGPKRCPPELLRAEGAAILSAVTEDLLRVVGVTVSTVLSEPIPAKLSSQVSVQSQRSPAEELALFQRLAEECDVCWIIAPETGGLLAERIGIADEAGAICCNCSRDATELCSDKLRLFEFLRDRDIPTIDTRLITEEGLGGEFPYVVKPRDGAGSDGCRLVSSAADWEGEVQNWEGEAPAEPRVARVVQPFVPGTPVSAVVIVGGDRRDVFPIGLQSIDAGNHLHYTGGVIPAGLAQTEADAVGEIVRQCVRAVDGLRGYVGFDLILPDADPSKPVLVEINPRLTTAYVGYRLLTEDNLAQRIAFPERSESRIGWTGGSVRFASDGRLIRNGGGL